jgi:hypothetical protein
VGGFLTVILGDALTAGDIDAYSADSYKWSLIAFRNYLTAEYVL